MPTPKIDAKYREYLIKIGLNVAYYRKLNNLTQKELAEKSGLSEVTISKIESADRYHGMSMNSIFRLADALDISVDKLFNFKR